MTLAAWLRRSWSRRRASSIADWISISGSIALSAADRNQDRMYAHSRLNILLSPLACSAECRWGGGARSGSAPASSATHSPSHAPEAAAPHTAAAPAAPHRTPEAAGHTPTAASPGHGEKRPQRRHQVVAGIGGLPLWSLPEALRLLFGGSRCRLAGLGRVGGGWFRLLRGWVAV